LTFYSNLLSSRAILRHRLTSISYLSLHWCYSCRHFQQIAIFYLFNFWFNANFPFIVFFFHLHSLCSRRNGMHRWRSWQNLENTNTMSSGVVFEIGQKSGVPFYVLVFSESQVFSEIIAVSIYFNFCDTENVNWKYSLWVCHFIITHKTMRKNCRNWKKISKLYSTWRQFCKF